MVNNITYTIPPLKWEREGGVIHQWIAEVPFGQYELIPPTHIIRKYRFFFMGHFQSFCLTLEEAKQMAEEHWQNLMRRGLVEVKK